MYLSANVFVVIVFRVEPSELMERPGSILPLAVGWTSHGRAARTATSVEEGTSPWGGPVPAPSFASRSRRSELVLRNVPYVSQDAVTVLLARTTAQLQAVERELAEERVKLEYTEEEILDMERKEEQAEAVSER